MRTIDDGGGASDGCLVKFHKIIRIPGISPHKKVNLTIFHFLNARPGPIVFDFLIVLPMDGSAAGGGPPPHVDETL